MGLKVKLVLLVVVAIALPVLGCTNKGDASSDHHAKRRGTSSTSTTATSTTSTTVAPVASTAQTAVTTTAPTTIASTTVAPTTVAPTTRPKGGGGESDGALILVAVAGGDLVAINTVTGTTRTIAKRADLVKAQGTDGRFGGLDLSPDRASVVFTFGGENQAVSSYRIYTVPADGSAPPTRRLPWKPDDEFVGAVRYAPSGRTVALARASHMTVTALDAKTWDARMSTALPYPPGSLEWSPDGRTITWLDHWERTSCCSTSTARIDSKTGLRMGQQGSPIAGSPWFDQKGRLRADQRFRYGVDTDVTHRFAVTLLTTDTEDTQALWWPADESAPAPRYLRFATRIDPYSPVAW